MKYIKPLSIFLFIISLAAGPFAFYLTYSIGNIEIFGFAAMTYLWIMFPLAILPAASFAFGIVMIKRKEKTKKNIIGGAIAFSFMIIMGFYSFAFESDQSGLFLVNASEVTGISMPYNVKSKAYHDYDGIVGNALLLDDKEIETFELETQSDRWVSELPPASKGLLPNTLNVEAVKFDRFCLYVLPDNIFNPKTISSGEYKITYIAYEKSKAHIYIYDYSLTIS